MSEDIVENPSTRYLLPPGPPSEREEDKDILVDEEDSLALDATVVK